MNEELKVSITIHLGKKPRKGGRPPKDIRRRKRVVLWEGDVLENLKEDKLDSEDEVHSKVINGIVIII